MPSPRRGQPRPRSTRVRHDARHPDGRLTDAEQLDRVAATLAAVRGEGRVSPRTRLDAVRWLLDAGWGPPSEGGPADGG